MITNTNLMYIILLLLFTLLLQRDKRKPQSVRIFSPSDTGKLHSLRQNVALNVEERRQRTRAGIIWPVSIETSQGIISAKIKNISVEGAFILCQVPLPFKKQFRITIDIPDREPLTLASEVIWSNNSVSEDKIVNRGIGIKFLKNTENVRESLNDAISDYS